MKYLLPALGLLVSGCQAQPSDHDTQTTGIEAPVSAETPTDVRSTETVGMSTAEKLAEAYLTNKAKVDAGEKPNYLQKARTCTDVLDSEHTKERVDYIYNSVMGGTYNYDGYNTSTYDHHVPEYVSGKHFRTPTPIIVMGLYEQDDSPNGWGNMINSCGAIRWVSEQATRKGFDTWVVEYSDPHSSFWYLHIVACPTKLGERECYDAIKKDQPAWWVTATKY